jgi:N-acyl homoserine lactone hydrolase
MKIGRYQIDVLVQGFPGKAVCRGGLGWSTVALVREDDRAILLDVGAFGVRPVLIKELAARGLKPCDVSDVILIHAHYDHSINWVTSPPRGSSLAPTSSPGRSSSRSA